MIFDRSLDNIKWETIERFCKEGLSEGTYLDYKESFPSKLEKTIAAFANTFGGVILIGIEENDQNQPVLPIKGIDFKRGLSEKITSIVLSRITPTLIPEIKIVTNEDNTKAIIVIRIQASKNPPHAISSNTDVYIRTNDLNNPEKRADLDEIDWLRNHRQKSIGFKNDILEQSKSRFNAYAGKAFLSRLSIEYPASNLSERNIFTIYSCPTYPGKIFLTPDKLDGLSEKLRVKDYYGTDDYFPSSQQVLTGKRVNLTTDSTIYSSVFLDNSSQEIRTFFTEINSFGFYFHRQPLNTIRFLETGFEKIALINLSEFLSRIRSFIESSLLYYKYIEYFGDLDFFITLENINNSGVIYDLGHNEKEFPFCPDNHLFIKDTMLVKDYEQEQKDTLLRALISIGYAFGNQFGITDLEKYLDKFKG